MVKKNEYRDIQREAIYTNVPKFRERNRNVVRKHYDNQAKIKGSVQSRKKSAIFGLRSFHNYIKVLVVMYITSLD